MFRLEQAGANGAIPLGSLHDRIRYDFRVRQSLLVRSRGVCDYKNLYARTERNGASKLCLPASNVMQPSRSQPSYPSAIARKASRWLVGIRAT